MANRPLTYSLTERKAVIGKMAGKIVLQARPTGRKLSPSFKSKIVEKGKEEFRPIIHITKPVVRLTPSKQYFTLKDVSYKRVEASTKKTKKKQISK